MFQELNNEFSQLVVKREELSKRLITLASAVNKAEASMVTAMRELVNLKAGVELTQVDIKIIDARMVELARHGIRCPCEKCRQEMMVAKALAARDAAHFRQDSTSNFAPRSSAEYIPKKMRRKDQLAASVSIPQKGEERQEEKDPLSIESAPAEVEEEEILGA